VTALLLALSATSVTAKPAELLSEATRLGDALVDGLLAPHLA
jgi:hypothetical protein